MSSLREMKRLMPHYITGISQTLSSRVIYFFVFLQVSIDIAKLTYYTDAIGIKGLAQWYNSSAIPGSLRALHTILALLVLYVLMR